MTAYCALWLEDNHLSQQQPLMLLAIGRHFATAMHLRHSVFCAGKKL